MSAAAAQPASAESFGYQPGPVLLAGAGAEGCRACVVLPARNEEAMLPACLDAFRAQVDLEGKPLDPRCFEILLLLNNCTDGSATVARRWAAKHPAMRLHVIECTLPPATAHAGTARRLLMDTAWSRLMATHAERGAILSTDADSTVAPDWVARNLQALAAGADAVGGLICLGAEELATLPPAVRQCYERDRRYAALIAQLEDRLDPQEGDPWPRHLDHFGSSLACTAEAYALAGGMPAVAPLEDEAFVDRLRRADLRLRHGPAVRVYTSARLDGRAEVGLAGQFRLWSELPEEGAHRVPSAAWLVHRFRTLRRLREAFAKQDPEPVSELPAAWLRRVREALDGSKSVPEFLAVVDCDRLVAETFQGVHEEWIVATIAELEAELELG